MAHVYPKVRAVLETLVAELDDELQGIRDDQLHAAVNQTSRQAAQALHRLDQIDAVINRPGRG